KPRPRSCHAFPYHTPRRARRPGPARRRARLFRSHTGDGAGARTRSRKECRTARSRVRAPRSPRAAGAWARPRTCRSGLPRSRPCRARPLAVSRAQAAVPALSRGRRRGRARGAGAPNRTTRERSGARGRRRHPAAVIECLESCGGGGGGGGGGVSPPPPSPGLYMTKAHFVDDFEGWLKGGPEFEVHILGQKGTSDSLTDYQCAGEKQPAPYSFDQNDLDWSGSVMLFSKGQLDAYHAAHPGQNVRVFVIEDDDTACQIKTSTELWKKALDAVDAANQVRTAGKDTTSSTGEKTWKYAQAFQKLLSALASLINTNDELVGNAVEDAVVGATYPGYNWIVKGENNAT